MLTTPTQTSPWNYFQERYRNDGWSVIVVVQLLNLTRGAQLESVVGPLFSRWPNASAMSMADDVELAAVLKPLGLQNRRARSLKRMSEAYLAGGWTSVKELPGCGKYAEDSYRIFVLGELVEDVDDKELRRYVSWAKEL